MVIHLGNMRNFHVDQTGMTVSFDGGCLWSDVDGALEAHGLATVGGAVNHTGVGGLILGGGHGWLTAKYGLTIDNLISAQVITADGAILEASVSQNPDLFWAIRGAGAQFGVVTRFTSRVYRQEEVWSGVLTFKPVKLPHLVAFANEFHERDSGEGHCLAIAVGYTPDGDRILSAIPLYHGSERDARKHFEKLLHIGSVMDSTGMMSIAQVDTLQNPMSEYGMRRLQGSGNVTIPLDIAAFQQTADAIWSFHDLNPNVTVAFAVELFSTHKLREVPQGATAYANRGDYYDAITMFGWTDPALDTTVRQFNSFMCAQIRCTNGYECPSYGGTGKNEEPVGRYLNMEAGSLTPHKAYGSNWTRLKEIKQKFDSENLFHKWHGVGLEQSSEAKGH